MPETHFASLTIDDRTPVSDTIEDEHFGANMLFHADRTTSTSDFSSLINSSGITSIRYPGGTISEQYFDPLKPNETTVYDYFELSNGRRDSNSREVLPLTEYLQFIQSIDGKPTIVFPTFRYFDQNTRGLTADGEVAIINFFTSLLNGEYGSTDEINIEIGNEWYQDNFNWTVAEFGQLQANIAKIINDTSSSLGLREKLNIFAQSSPNPSENSILASFFDDNKSQHIDGVTVHIYGTNSQGNTLGIGGAIRSRLENTMGAWDSIIESDLLLAVTEWNVGENGEGDTSINGLMRSAPLLRIFAEMVEFGVDLAHIWSTQTAGPAGLSGREGTGSNWSPTGRLFNMLIDGALGSQLLETDGSFRLRDDTNTEFGYTYSFLQTNKLNIFLSSAVDYEIALEISLEAVLEGASHVYTKVLTAEQDTTGQEYRSTAAIELQFATVQAYETTVFQNLSLQLGAYDTIQVIVSYGTGVSIEADKQINISDELIGSVFDDTLNGGLGADLLTGLSGNDLLLGGDGSDTIFGGPQHDSIWGGGDSDVLYGDQGDDNLFGDAGDDLLLGGEGNDTLNGGAGNDTLRGGLGNDELFGGEGDDRIVSESYTDIIDGGAGHDILSLAGSNESVSVWTGLEFAEFGNKKLSFGNIEVIETTELSDRVSLNGKIKKVFTHQGDDTLEIWESEDATVYLGSGDDFVFSVGGSENEIFGGEGNDDFFIAFGENTFMGGDGDDTFTIHSNSGTTIYYQQGDGHDVITGFVFHRDKLAIAKELRPLLTTQTDREGTSLIFGEEGSIRLFGNYDEAISSLIDFF